MSYEENILNRIDHCFEVQLDRIKEYKSNVQSTYERIIKILETDDNIQIDKQYTYVNKTDDKVEFNVKVRMPIDDSLCSILRLFFETIDPKHIDISSKIDYSSDLDKKNFEYGKKYLNTKFKEYFSKCNFDYVNSIVHIENENILEMNFVRKEYYSNIV